MTDSQKRNEWYSVRTIYLTEERPAAIYEERIVLFLAIDFDDAIAQAEAEGDAHARLVGKSRIDFAMAFALDPVDSRANLLAKASGTEVFSLMRKSLLSPTDFMKRFYDTGSEVTSHDT